MSEKKSTIISLAAVLIIASPIAVLLSMGAAAPVSKYWQDLLLKPGQAWIENYGYNNESVLAYNVARIIQLDNTQGREIERLQERIKSIEENYAIKPEKVWESVIADPNDPNEVKE